VAPIKLNYLPVAEIGWVIFAFCKLKLILLSLEIGYFLTQAEGIFILLL